MDSYRATLSSYLVWASYSYLEWLAPGRFLFFVVLYAICPMTPRCFVDYELACLTNYGTDNVCFHTHDSLYWLHSLLASHPILTSSRQLCIHVT